MAQPTFGSNRGPDQKNLVTQGLVTLNCGSGIKIAEWRLRNVNQLEHFATSGVNGSDVAAGLHIKPWELMLSYKDTEKTAKNYARSHISRNMTNLLLEPFTKFNGIKKKSEAEFRKELFPIGFAADYHIYEEPSQPDLGVAAVIAGSFTTKNTGLEMWTPGVLIKWSPPPMIGTDPSPIDTKTDEFVQKRLQAGAISPSEPKDQFPAVLEPFDFDRDVKRVVGGKLTRAVAEIKQNPNMKIDSENVSDDVAFWRRHMRANLLTAMKLVFFAQQGLERRRTEDETQALTGDLSRVAESGKYEGLDVGTLVELSQLLYMGYDAGYQTVWSARAGRSVVEASQQDVGDSFHVCAQAIHESMEQVVCKSIGFSLPGAGADVVV